MACYCYVHLSHCMGVCARECVVVTPMLPQTDWAHGCTAQNGALLHTPLLSSHEDKLVVPPVTVSAIWSTMGSPAASPGEPNRRLSQSHCRICWYLLSSFLPLSSTWWGGRIRSSPQTFKLLSCLTLGSGFSAAAVMMLQGYGPYMY